MLDVTRRDDDLLFVELVNRQLRERLELLLCLILTIKREWHHVDKYELRKKLLENLFDRNYQKVYGYNTPGFGAFLTIQYSPENK